MKNIILGFALGFVAHKLYVNSTKKARVIKEDSI